jgi:hypothetical protein
MGMLLAFGMCLLVGAANGRDDTPKKLTDEQISKLLVGKWLVDLEEGNGVKIKGSTTYKKDGAVDAEATIQLGDKTIKMNVSGTWKVKDGTIISTVTKTSNPDIIKEGLITKDKVVSIDDKSLKYTSEDGKEREEKRAKD